MIVPMQVLVDTEGLGAYDVAYVPQERLLPFEDIAKEEVKVKHNAVSCFVCRNFACFSCFVLLRRLRSVELRAVGRHWCALSCKDSAKASGIRRRQSVLNPG